MKDQDFENKLVDFLKNNLSIELCSDSRMVGGEYGYLEKTITSKIYLKVGDDNILITESSTDISE